MASYNRVVLLGNLTRDPELRYLQSGMAVTDIGLAVNDRRKNASGEWVDEATFVDITLWGRTAEVACEYLHKGSPVFIEGRLKLDTWETNDGQKRSKLKVVGERMQLIGAPRGAGGGPAGGAAGGPAGGAGGGHAARPAPQAASYNQAPPEEDYGAPPADSPPGDDIPF